MLFSKEEYKQRLDKVKKMMQEKGIDLLISHDTNNMNYLTGYDAWSFYYAQCAIVHIDAEEPLCFVRAQDAGGAYIKTYLKNESVLVYDENYIHKWPKHPYDNLVEIIKEKNWDKLSIGVEMDAHYFTAFCYEKLKQGLPNAKIKDSDRLVNWARLVKSDTEINFMKSAAKISELGMKTAMEVIKPGVRQCDAVGEIQKTLFYGTEEFGGEYSSIATLLPTGKGTSASHLTATQDKFVEGEATIVELSGVYKRYHAPMARTVLLGKPNQLKIDTMNKTIEALNAGISVIKPGNTADDVAQEFWKVLDKYDLSPKFIDIQRLAPYTVRGTDVPVVLDLMIHDIDILLSLVQSKVKSIHASGVSILTNSVDIAHARIRFDNGTVSSITSSRVAKDRVRKIKIFQEKFIYRQ